MPNIEYLRLKARQCRELLRGRDREDGRDRSGKSAGRKRRLRLRERRSCTEEDGDDGEDDRPCGWHNLQVQTVFQTIALSSTCQK